MKHIDFLQPHHWRTIRDTKFTLGRFQKQVDESMYREGEDEPKLEATPPALDPKHVIGMVLSYF